MTVIGVVKALKELGKPSAVEIAIVFFVITNTFFVLYQIIEKFNN